ncbi:MAG: tetratricopeptide repeat protein [Pyrinomonadaceae bacterium]
MTRKTNSIIVTVVLIAAIVFGHLSAAAQPKDPLTYPEVITALQTKLPNQVFQNKAQMLDFVITQIKLRKLDKPLTRDREDDLRQAGATEELVRVIRTNSPAVAVRPAEPVDVGDLVSWAVNLVKPEYTAEAIKARTSGEVKLALEMDENGRVTSVTRLAILPNGLTENAVDAALKSTFRPAMRDGKPARGKGILKYNFKVNLVDIQATLAAADGLRSRRECDKAVHEYNRVIDIEPAHSRALLGRATCHLMDARYDMALTDLSKAAANNDRDPDIFFYLAITNDFKGDAVAAAESYGKALKLRPDLDSQPTFRCLYIDRRRMTADEARSAAGGIIDACEDSFGNASEHLSSLLYYKRGIAYRLKRDYDKAIADFENVRRMNPRFAAVNTQFQIVYNSRGLEEFNDKKYQDAFDDISLAINADPKNPTPYINRCAIYIFAWKKYREAIEDCSEAIRIGTRSSMAYYYRAQAYEMTNVNEKAISDYKKALDLDPRNDSARKGLERVELARPSMKY